MQRSLFAYFSLFLVGIPACSGHDDASAPADESPSAPSFVLDVSTNKLPVLQGTSQTLTVSVQRNADFTGAITLSVEGLPAGTRVAPISIAHDETQAVLELTAENDAPHSLPTTISVIGKSAGVEASRDATVTVHGPPGSLDSSFVGGKVVVPVGKADAYAYAVAQDDEGRLVVAGNCYDHHGDFALLRLTRDGQLDDSFGDGGVVTTEVGTGSDVARAIAIDAAGRIVVAGTSDGYTSGVDFAVVRYLPDGSLDESFGAGGKVTTALGDDSDTAYALLLQSDGKIVVGGDSNRGSASTGLDFALVRYLADGQLDEGFGTNGIVTQSVAAFGGRDSVYALALHERSGKPGLVVVGGEGDFSVARFDADGSLDTAFAEQGLRTGLFGSTIGAARAVAVNAEGDVFIAGHVGHDFALSKLTASGELDTRFGAQGQVVTSVSDGNWDEAHGLALDDDGKIVVAGWAYEGNGSNGNTALLRYTDAGALDDTFGEGGVVVTPVAVASKPDQGTALLLQADDRVPAVRIVVAGFASTSFSEFAVTRFWR